MGKFLRLCVLLVLVFLVAAPAASAKRPKPPPPDTAEDCTFVAEAIVPDYLVISTINVGVRCASTKQTITVHSEFTRDGAFVYVLPYGTDITCTDTAKGAGCRAFDGGVPDRVEGVARHAGAGAGVFAVQAVATVVAPAGSTGTRPTGCDRVRAN
jgi:hypothetical protein